MEEHGVHGMEEQVITRLIATAPNLSVAGRRANASVAYPLNVKRELLDWCEVTRRRKQRAQAVATVPNRMVINPFLRRP